MLARSSGRATWWLVAGLGPSRGRVLCGPGGRTGLTGHRALSRV